MGAGGDNPGGYCERHASRQASYNDNAAGIMDAGLRVDVDPPSCGGGA
jgi:hypothetical protein